MYMYMCMYINKHIYIYIYVFWCSEPPTRAVCGLVVRWDPSVALHIGTPV